MVMRGFYLVLIAAGLSVVLVQRFAVSEIQSMSYEGWHGASDFANGRYIGCHLDSPPATPDLEDEPIRVAVGAEYPSDVVIQFSDNWEPPTGNPGPLAPVTSTKTVELGTVTGTNSFHEDYHADRDYRVRVLSYSQASENKYVTRYLLYIPVADNELLTHLREAKALIVHFTASNIFAGARKFKSINLRHVMLGPRTLSTDNDTYGAIQTVLDCVRIPPS